MFGTSWRAYEIIGISLFECALLAAQSSGRRHRVENGADEAGVSKRNCSALNINDYLRARYITAR